MADSFNGFTLPSPAAICPYDSSPWTNISLDRRGAVGVVDYSCGTSREVEASGEERFNQSNGCVRNQLRILRDLDEPGLRSELKSALDALAIAQAGLNSSANQIALLTAEVDRLKGEIASHKATGFKVTVGTPKAKKVKG